MQTIRKEISFTEMKKRGVYVNQSIVGHNVITSVFRFNGLLEMIGPNKFRIGYNVIVDTQHESVSVIKDGSFISLVDKEKFYDANEEDIKMIRDVPIFKVYNKEEIEKKKKAILMYMAYGDVYVYDRISEKRYRIAIDKYLDNDVKRVMYDYYSIEENNKENTVSIFQAIYDSNLLLMLKKLDKYEVKNALNICVKKGINYFYEILADIDQLVENDLAIYLDDIR